VKFKIGLLLFLLALDLGSKWAALHFLPMQGIPLLPHLFGVTFSLDLVTNTGTAWGLLSDFSFLLFWIRIGLLIGLIWYGIREKFSFPLWLIAVGAVGNLIDSVQHGYVIDFFHFTFWGYSFPVFNCADSYITLGIAFFLLFGSSTKRLSVL
jgi:signal peptidase II